MPSFFVILKRNSSFFVAQHLPIPNVQHAIDHCDPPPQTDRAPLIDRQHSLALNTFVCYNLLMIVGKIKIHLPVQFADSYNLHSLLPLRVKDTQEDQ